MVSAIGQAPGSTASNSTTTQIVTLEKLLAKYEKQLKQEEAASKGSTSSTAEQTLSAQIASLQAQITQLTNASVVANGGGNADVGNRQTAVDGNASSSSSTPTLSTADSNVQRSTAQPQKRASNSLVGNNVDVSV